MRPKRLCLRLRRDDDLHERVHGPRVNTLPPLVRQWLPQRVSFGAAVFTNGLLVGETLPVMVTIPLVLPLVDGSWRWALAIWGLPLALIAILTAALAPAPKQAAVTAPAAGHDWWPDWRNPLTWQTGILLGSVNSVYFCSNAFLPGYLTDAGEPIDSGANPGPAWQPQN